MASPLFPAFPTFPRKGGIKRDATAAAKALKDVFKLDPDAKNLSKLQTTSLEIALKRATARVKREKGDVQDMRVVRGQLIIETGPYRGNTFVWLVSNDVGYAMYLWRDFEKRGGNVSAFGSHNANVSATMRELVRYMRLFPELLGLHKSDGQRDTSKCECFSSETDRTELSPQSSSEQLEHLKSSTVNPEPGTSDSQVTTGKEAIPAISTPAQSKGGKPTETALVPSSSRRWSKQVSAAQEQWMVSKLEGDGWIASAKLVNADQSSLWYLPPPGQLAARAPGQLPKPSDFSLHPMFVWMPDKFNHLFPSGLPCINCRNTDGVCRKQLGEPRVVVGSGGGILDLGQYYVVSVYLRCKRCNVSAWRADQPAYLQKLPDLVRDMFPAHVTYRKRVCRSVMDRLMRPGRSPADVAAEVRDLLKVRYERAHLAYLQMVSKVKAAGSLDSVQFGLDPTASAAPFGDYNDPDGWSGVEVSQEFMVGCLITIYQEQRAYLYGLMKGTFGKFLKSDHTRTFAKKSERLSGAMWSYSCCNEYQEIISWVLVGGAGETELKPLYEGLGNRFSMSDVQLPLLRWVDRDCCNFQASTPKTPSVNPEVTMGSTVVPVVKKMTSGVNVPQTNLSVEELLEFRTPFAYPSSCRLYLSEDIIELLDPFHCMRRLGRACVSEAHPLFGKFMSLLSGAFFIVDDGDMTRLLKAVKVVGLARPSKDQIRRHCRLVIPPAEQLYKRVEAVLNEFWRLDSFSPPGSVPLFDERMKEEWAVQGLHMKRACLSDPVAPASGDHPAGIAYRIVKFEFLQSSKSPRAKLPVYQTVRGTSQLEGFHPHQARWVTGTRVSPALFQAQGMFGVCKWNYKRAREHRNLDLPTVFNPKLHAQLNAQHQKEFGSARYPDLVFNLNETEELFGVEYMSWEYVRAEMEMVTGDCDTNSQSETPATLEVCPDTGETAVVMSLDRLELDSISSVDDLMSKQDPTTQTRPDESQEPTITPVKDRALTPGTSTSPESPADPSHSSDSTPSPSIKISAKLALRKAAQAGVDAKPIPPDKWPSDTKNLIDSLLSKYSGKDKLKSVLHEYLQRMRTARNELNLELVYTNMNFLRAYEKRCNRELSQKQAIVLGGGHFSIPHLEAQVQKPADMRDKFTVIDVDRSLAPEVLPGFSGTIELVEEMPTDPAPETSTAGSKPSKKRKSAPEADDSAEPGTSGTAVPHRKREKKHDKSGTNVSGRNCLHCGQPMAKESSWHRKEIIKGQPCFFFCPEQMMQLYELSEEPFSLSKPPSLDEFKLLKSGDSSPYLQHLAMLRAKKEEMAAAKAARAAKREQQGYKAPGVAKGSRLAVRDRE